MESKTSEHTDTETEIRTLCDRVHNKHDRTAWTMATVRRLLPWIASTDGELRDSLVYVSLCDVLEMGNFQRNDLEWVLDELISDRYLFRGIGPAESDDVFCRSFSLLIVDAILGTRAAHHMSTQTLQQVWDAYRDYVIRENDLRGYVKGKGWAHSLAHGADVAYSLITLNTPSKADVLQLFDIWRVKLSDGAYVFIDEEGERLLRAVFAALDVGILDEDDLCQVAASYGSTPVSNDYPLGQHAGENLKIFLMCWHIHADERRLDQLSTATYEALQTLKKQRSKWY